MTQQDIRKLRTFHTRCLRDILGITLWNMQRNADILKEIGHTHCTIGETVIGEWYSQTLPLLWLCQQPHAFHTIAGYLPRYPSIRSHMVLGSTCVRCHHVHPPYLILLSPILCPNVQFSTPPALPLTLKSSLALTSSVQWITCDQEQSIMLTL